MATTQVPAMTDAPPFERVMQLANGFALSSALYVVTKLDVPDLLAQGARPVSAGGTLGRIGHFSTLQHLT